MSNTITTVVAVLMVSAVCWAVTCPECGTSGADGAAVCKECGTKLPVAKSPPPPKPTTKPAAKPAPPPKPATKPAPPPKPARLPAGKPEPAPTTKPRATGYRRPRRSRGPARGSAAGRQIDLVFDPVTNEHQRRPLTFGKPSDKAVDDALAGGVARLFSLQSADGSWRPYAPHGAKGHQNYQLTGPTAMAVYALLEAGASLQDQRIARALEWLSKQKETRTYSLALRANAYLAAIRKGAIKFRGPLLADARALWSNSTNGGYDYYADPRRRPGRYDNSNSQYGLLGVWAAAQAGLEVPSGYWQTVWGHWSRTQRSDGGWSYTGQAKDGTRATMTVAGIASMLVCYDRIHTAEFLRCRLSSKGFRPIRNGLKWLEDNFTTSAGEHTHYYLYGVERVGLASGYKYFGAVDWYKEGAKTLMATDARGGGWGYAADTSFALLFLARGRAPVLVNKLSHDGDWNNRPGALAVLTRWMSKTYERRVHWQVVDIRAPVHEWLDAPILLIVGAKKPNFSDAGLAKLRQYVLEGGVIFSMTECKGKPFRDGIREVYRKMFPQYELKALGKGHEIYSRDVAFQIAPASPIYVVWNGVRPLVVHTDNDWARDWQARLYATHKSSFEAGANIIRYIIEKVALARSRGHSPWAHPAAPPNGKAPAGKGGAMLVARLKHSGNYDPEPYAFVRFTQLAALLPPHIRVTVLGPMDIASLPQSGAKLAILSGTGYFTLTPAERTTLKNFAADGGTILFEATGGCRRFTYRAADILAAMYPGQKLRKLAADCPVYKAGKPPIKSVTYRRKTAKRLNRRVNTPLLQGLAVNGRAAVIVSGEDIIGGLLGCPFYTLDGYRCRSAHAIMQSIILYADKAPKSGQPKR